MVEIMFNADLPIESEDADKLNRVKFATELSSCIKSYNNNECLTIGIMGEWGSGKTSIINLVREQLKKHNEKTPNDVKIIEFNPWYFSCQNNLLYQFFNILKNKLKDNKEILSKITQYYKKIISNYEISTGMKIPYLNIQISKIHNESKDTMDSIMKIKEDINDKSEKLNDKLLIIIDDIDRLTDDKIKQIFILVKSLADFSNIIYILSFDKKAVLKSLKSLHNYSPELFLDKIIQVMIDIPKPRKYDIYNCIKQYIFELFEKDNNIHKIDLVNMINDYLIFFLIILEI